jgi:hypothetical protein
VDCPLDLTELRSDLAGSEVEWLDSAEPLASHYRAVNFPIESAVGKIGRFVECAHL